MAFSGCRPKSPTAFAGLMMETLKYCKTSSDGSGRLARPPSHCFINFVRMESWQMQYYTAYTISSGIMRSQYNTAYAISTIHLTLAFHDGSYPE